MRAARIHETGPPETIQIDEIAPPAVRAGHVRVANRYAGVNFLDVYHRSGAYPIALPRVLGMEGAGHLLDDAPEAGLHKDDPVAYVQVAGSYAETTSVPTDRLIRLPDDLDPKHAATVLLQGLTAHYLAHDIGQLAPGRSALVFAPAGGVGSLLVPMAKALGATVIAVTTHAEKAARAKALGADDVIVEPGEDLAEEVGRRNGGTKVDVVFDSVGRATFDRSLASLRPRGLMVLYGQSSGPVPPFDPQRLARGGSLSLIRPNLQDYIVGREGLAQRADALFTMLRDGTVPLPPAHVLPLADARQAHALLESGTTTGKLLLATR